MEIEEHDRMVAALDEVRIRLFTMRGRIEVRCRLTNSQMKKLIGRVA